MSGTYTDVVEIVAPSSARAGETVSITIKVKNIWDYTFLIRVDASYDTTPFYSLQYYIAPGVTESFPCSFTMPNKSVTIYASSSYWLYGDIWKLDDERTKSVSLAEAYKGTITRKELEYDESRASIPASNIPQNKRGLVHIWGRNDMTTTQRMGIWWQVKNPAGAVVETHSEWELLPYTGAGSTHEFIGGRFPLDKSGTWKIDVALYMNPDNPTIVDRYTGTLCTSELAQPVISQFTIVDYKKI